MVLYFQTEKFYADPHKFALKLQLWILYQRYMTYVSAVKHILKTGVCCRGILVEEIYASSNHPQIKE